MRSAGANAWVTPEALALTIAVLPRLGVAHQGVHHGSWGMHGIGRYCSCCDTYRRGSSECEECRAPWERQS